MSFKKIFFLLIFIVLIAGVMNVSAENIGEVDDISTSDVDEIVTVDDSNTEPTAVDEVEQTGVDDNLLSAPEETVNNNDSKISAENNENVLSEPNEVYLSPKTISSTDFSQADTIFYLNNGTYDLQQGGTGIMIGNDASFNPLNNILIRPNGNAEVTIQFTKNTGTYLLFGLAKNITIENIRFTSTIASQQSLVQVMAGAEVTFRNCTFDNVIATSQSPMIKLQSNDRFPDPAINLVGCTFTNCSGVTALISISGTESSIINCTFKDNKVYSIYNKLILSPFINIVKGDVVIENNTFDYVTPITVSGGNIVSDVSFNVITKELLMDTPNQNIVAELIDGEGNHIEATTLKFYINEEVKTHTFDSATGRYTVTYTPENNDPVSVRVECSNIEDFYPDAVTLNIVASPEISIEAPAITYGDSVINVTATMKDDIDGENVTFILAKGSTVIEVINTTVNNGFADATFNQKLDAGSYTITVSYAGNSNYGSADVSKTLTVNKANPNVNATVDSVIAAGDSIVITFTAPEEVTGTINSVRIGKYKEGWGGMNNIVEQDNINIVPGNAIQVTFDSLPVLDGNFAGGYYYIKYQFTSTNPNYANRGLDADNTAEARAKLLKFTIVQLEPSLNVTYSNPVPGEDVVITIIMDDDINDNVTVTINDISEIIALVNGTASKSIQDVSAGDIYVVNVDFEGNVRYLAKSNKTSFIVPKADTTVDLSVGDITVGEDVELTIALADDINDNVTVFVDGVSESVKLADGSAVYTIKAVTAGIHNVLVNFEGNDKYNRDYGYLAFNVEKLNTTLEATSNPISGGEDAVITVAVDPEATGFVLINSTYYAAISGGSATVTIPNLANGTYTYTVVYSGDEKYNRKETAVTVTVIKLKTSISCEPVITVYGSDDYLVAKLTDENGKAIIGAIVTVELNGSKTYTSDGNGTVKVPLKDLAPNTYDAVIAFAGNESHAASNATAKVIITQSSVVLNASYTVSVLDDGFTVNIIVNTNPSINGNLTIKFNGGEYPVEVANGTANFTSDKVYANTYATDIIYPGSGEYGNSSTTVNALVKSTSVTQLNAFDYYYYNNDMGSDSEKGISQIKVVDSDGNPIKNGLVTITIMNKYKLKVKTDANGIAKFTKAYKPGTYTVTATHNNKTTKLGDLVLKSVVTVPKVTTVKKSAKSTTLKITLKGTGPIKGKEVVVNFMKKNYKVKTDNNGVAQFKITQDMVSKLGVGKTYKIRATYRMDSVAQSIKILK